MSRTSRLERLERARALEPDKPEQNLVALEVWPGEIVMVPPEVLARIERVYGGSPGRPQSA